MIVSMESILGLGETSLSPRRIFHLETIAEHVLAMGKASRFCLGTNIQESVTK